MQLLELLGRRLRRRAHHQVLGALVHREQVVREVDFLLLLVPLVHGKIDDPAQIEAVLGDQPELLPDFGARRTCELDEILRLAGDEEAGIASTQVQLLTDQFSPLRANIVCKRSASSNTFSFAVAINLNSCLLKSLNNRLSYRTGFQTFAKHYVSKTGLPLALRPRIHAVAKCSRAAAWGRNRPNLSLRAWQDSCNNF